MQVSPGLECDTGRLLDGQKCKFAPFLLRLVVAGGTLQGPHTQGLAACTALVEFTLNNACWSCGKDDDDDNKDLYYPGTCDIQNELVTISTGIGFLTRPEQ